MNKAKKVALITAMAVVALAVVFYASGVQVSAWFGEKEHHSNIAMGCDPPTSYEQEDGVGYLTIPYANLDGWLRMAVEDEALQKKLAQSDVGTVIGINLDVTVPNGAWREMYPEGREFDGFSYLGSQYANQDSGYLVVREVYY